MAEQEEQEKKASRQSRHRPETPSFTGASGLFSNLKKPVEQPEQQQESDSGVQQVSETQERQEDLTTKQEYEAPDHQNPVAPTSQFPVREVPHAESISPENLAGQNTGIRNVVSLGNMAAVPLKKPRESPAQQHSNRVEQQPGSQVVQRQITKVTIEIYEDQRRAIEAEYTRRIYALLDSGVQVDRRKYQESVIYRELLDIAIAVLRQQKSREE